MSYNLNEQKESDFGGLFENLRSEWVDSLQVY